MKIDQQRLDHELDFIESQQRELEDMLQPLEKSVNELPPINYQQHADIEREHTYVFTLSRFFVEILIYFQMMQYKNSVVWYIILGYDFIAF